MSTTTDWVLRGATAASLTFATPISTPAIASVRGPGDAVEQVVNDVSLYFDMEAELGPLFAASEETIRLLRDLV